MDHEWSSLEVAKTEHRTAIVAILAENGYTVRITRRKKTDKTRNYTYYVEYKKESQANGG